MNIPRPLPRAWMALIVLSFATTVLSLVAGEHVWAAAAGLAILGAAWIKARIVLSWYMGLANAPIWQRGFDICLGIFVLTLAVLYLAPEFI